MVHDWRRTYWRNAKSGEKRREFDPEGLNPPDDVLVMYENSDGVQCGYRLARDSDGVDEKYVIVFDGEVVRDVSLTGPNFEEEFEVLAFDTRRAAREACRDLRELKPEIPDELDELGWEELLEIGEAYGFNQNDGRQKIEEGLRELKG